MWHCRQTVQVRTVASCQYTCAAWLSYLSFLRMCRSCGRTSHWTGADRSPAGLSHLRGEQRTRALGCGREGGHQKGALPEGKTHLDRRKTLSHPYMTSRSQQVHQLLSLCVPAMEVQGQFVLSMAGRGFDNHIIKGSDVSFFESDCVSCGACAQTCPTSAISDVFESKSVVGTEVTRTRCTLLWSGM